MHDNDARPIGWLLGCLGTAAVLVILFPVLAVAGYMMGILPGLFLGAAPSLLIYVALWWSLRQAIMLMPLGFGLQRLRLRTAGIAAASLVVAIVIGLPMVCNLPLDRAPADYQATDIAPPQRLALTGIVAVIVPDNIARRNPTCDALCQHLLFEAGVTRVIGVSETLDGQRVTSYRIERGSGCPLQALAPALPLKRIDGETAAEQSQRFRSRIAAGECLIDEPGHLADADVTIKLSIVHRGVGRFDAPWRLTRDVAEVRRLDIVTSDHRIPFRRTEVTVDRLMIPLLSTAAGGLLTSVTYVGWSRVRTISSPLGPQGRDALGAVLASLTSDR